MAGHSKWAQIKHKKQATDVKRAQEFTKLSRLITLAVREGGGHTDPKINVRLRMAIDRARTYDMPKENIKRAVDKAISKESATITEVTYEAYGVGGVSFIIEATTDNPNRTFAQVRFELEKHNAKIANPGSVLYLFTKCGLVTIPYEDKGQEELFELAQSWKAIDMELSEAEGGGDNNEKVAYVYIPFEQIGQIEGYETSIIFRPNTVIPITQQEEASKIVACIEALNNLDDVHDVYTNADISADHTKEVYY